MTVSELNKALDITRKYAIPLLEHMDARGVTRRDGDVRVWAKGGDDAMAREDPADRDGLLRGLSGQTGSGGPERRGQRLFANVTRDPNVLVGFGTLDDAGVYRLSDTQALVQTVDFITPVVDDPFAYGEIAVANSLSDVYAMGGRPVTALNVVCFPGGFDPGSCTRSCAAAWPSLTEAGVALLGGHTVDDPEIKYGASVTGLIDPRRI